METKLLLSRKLSHYILNIRTFFFIYITEFNNILYLDGEIRSISSKERCSRQVLSQRTKDFTERNILILWHILDEKLHTYARARTHS